MELFYEHTPFDLFATLNESYIVTPDDSLYDFVCKFKKPQRNMLFNKLCSLCRNSLHDSEIMQVR